MIKYLGSKRRLLPSIVAATQELPTVHTALDLFSGTSRVGHALKNVGLRVTANDHLAYAATLAKCYVEADAERWIEPTEKLLNELSKVTPKSGYFTETFCEKARFFQPENGAKIDAIREHIKQLSLDPTLESIALVSLMEAADRVDSTTGVQMAYLKKWAPRSFKTLELRVPNMLPGTGYALQLEAEEAAKTTVDLAYLDPPYNQHRYVGNYHIWETLVRWDAPETYGVAQKRIGSKNVKSDFNSKVRIKAGFERVIAALDAKHIIVSFNNEGYLGRDELVEVLERRGEVAVADIGYPRYVGAKIGIHNHKGHKVGKIGRLENIEHLFVVSEHMRDAKAAADAAANISLSKK